jgi:anti-sigma B factor antagonist
MNIRKNQIGKEIKLILKGRLDTSAAPQLEHMIDDLPENLLELTFDFKDLDYISSSGMRIVLAAHKMMAAKEGKLTVENVNDVIMEQFEVTGFTDILTIRS